MYVSHNPSPSLFGLSSSKHVKDVSSHELSGHASEVFIQKSFTDSRPVRTDSSNKQ